MTTVYHASLSLPKDLVFISAITSTYLVDEDGFVRTVKFYEIAWKTMFERSSTPMLIIPFDNNFFIITKKIYVGSVRKEFGKNYPDIKLDTIEEEGIPRGLLEQTMKVIILRVLADKGWMKVKDDSFIYAPLAPEERKKSSVRPLVTLRFTLHGESEAYFTIETSAAKFNSLTLDTLLPVYEDDASDAAKKNERDLKTRFNEGERIVNKDLDITNCLVLPAFNMATISFIQKEPPTVGEITAEVFKNYWRFMYGYKLTDQLLKQGWASVALFTFMSYPVCCLTSTAGLIELKGRARSVKSKIVKHFLNDLSNVTLPLHENGELFFSFKKMDKQPMTFDTAFVSVAKLIAQPEHPNLTPQADTEKKQKTKKPFDPQDIDAILTALNPAGEAAEEAPVIRKKRPVAVQTPSLPKSPPKPSVPKPLGRTLGLKVRQVEPVLQSTSKPLPTGRTLGAKRKQVSDGPLYEKGPLAKKRKVQTSAASAPEETTNNGTNNNGAVSTAEELNDTSVSEEQSHEMSTSDDANGEFKVPGEPAKKRETVLDVSNIDVASLLSSNAVGSLSVPQLKAVLKSGKLSASGKKQELIERVKNNSALFCK
jgi:hypothetical protein